MSTKYVALEILGAHAQAEPAAHPWHRYAPLFNTLAFGGKEHRVGAPAADDLNSDAPRRNTSKSSIFWSRVWVTLFGFAIFLFPLGGMLILAGPLAAMMVVALESTVILVALMRMGARLDRVVREQR